MASSVDKVGGCKPRISLLLAAYVGLVGVWGLSQLFLVSFVANTVSYWSDRSKGFLALRG